MPSYLTFPILSEELDEVRLVEEGSRCAGGVEVKHQAEWRRLETVESCSTWTMKTAAVFCRQLECGSAVSTTWFPDIEDRPTARFSSQCAGSESTLRECVTMERGFNSYGSQQVVCSGKTHQIIRFS